MIHTFAVKNFRCFNALTLGTSERPLSRFNLIGGVNNAGKTALLEAIYWFGLRGHSSVPFTMNESRGIAPFRSSARDICSWLFLNQDTDLAIEMKAEYSKGTGALRAKIEERFAGYISSPDDGVQGTEAVREEPLRIGFPYLDSRFETSWGDSTTSSIILDANREFPSETRKKGLHCLMVAANERFAPVYLEFFSQLEISGRQEELLRALRVLDPRLVRLSLLVVQAEAMLYGGQEGKSLVPLAFFGEGIRRAMYFVLTILNAPKGIVLIDEIENGLHYSVLKDVWTAIAAAARSADVQVFATTHSWECIRAAHEAFSEGEEYDFRLHRLDRHDDGIKAVSYDRDMIEAALLTGLEMR